MENKKMENKKETENNKMLEKEEEVEMDTNKTVKIIEELADRITEELQNQLEEDGLDLEEDLQDSDSEGEPKSRLYLANTGKLFCL
jgi:hypothetical protein